MLLHRKHDGAVIVGEAEGLLLGVFICKLTVGESQIQIINYNSTVLNLLKINQNY